MPIITVCDENDRERIYTMSYFSKRMNELSGNATNYNLPGLGHTIVNNSDYSVFRDEKYDLVNRMIKQTKKIIVFNYKDLKWLNILIIFLF